MGDRSGAQLSRLRVHTMSGRRVHASLAITSAPSIGDDTMLAGRTCGDSLRLVICRAITTAPMLNLVSAPFALVGLSVGFSRVVNAWLLHLESTRNECRRRCLLSARRSQTPLKESSFAGGDRRSSRPDGASTQSDKCSAIRTSVMLDLSERIL